MENDILLNKEHEKNNIDKTICEVELDNTKHNFAKEMLSGLGETINIYTINPTPQRYNKWFYIKRFFNKIFKKQKVNEFVEY